MQQVARDARLWPAGGGAFRNTDEGSHRHTRALLIIYGGQVTTRHHVL